MKKWIGSVIVATMMFHTGVPSSYGLSDTRDSDSPFGVLTFLGWNHDWNFRHYSWQRIQTAIKLMKEAGVGFVRMDFLWDDVEPVQGRFEFEKYDRIVDLLNRNDIKILGLLSYNASWAADSWNSPPDRELFVNYARAVVNRYKGSVKYWEIWNEPDDIQYWSELDSMKSYTLLLKEVYPALKAEDPTCVILMGGVSQTIHVSLKNIYRNGGKDYFDVINLHPFVDPKLQNASESFRGIFKGLYKVMERYEDQDKKIWITEIGCPGLKENSENSGWWLGRAPSEEEQAAWVQTVYTEALNMKGVEKVFWAFFRDTPNHFRNAIDHFGLVRNDFSKKLSFKTYKELNQLTEPIH